MSTNCIASGLEKRLESTVRKALFDHCMIDGSDIAIALSGGKDSLTMLYLLKKISGRGFPPFKMHPIYIDGEVSCGPAITKSFLESICEEWDMPLQTIKSNLTKEQIHCYRCSRERRSLLFAKARELGCKTVAFGHHRDDSIETLMMNLCHKGEFAANLAKVPMHDYGVTILRPLIYVWEKDITTFAKQKGYARITCQCPIGQNSKRKQVKNILHALQEAFPHIKENLAHAAENYGSDKAIARKAKKE